MGAGPGGGACSGSCRPAAAPTTRSGALLSPCWRGARAPRQTTTALRVLQHSQLIVMYLLPAGRGLVKRVARQSHTWQGGNYMPACKKASLIAKHCTRCVHPPLFQARARRCAHSSQARWPACAQPTRAAHTPCCTLSNKSPPPHIIPAPFRATAAAQFGPASCPSACLIRGPSAGRRLTFTGRAAGQPAAGCSSACTL